MVRRPLSVRDSSAVTFRSSFSTRASREPWLRGARNPRFGAPHERSLRVPCEGPSCPFCAALRTARSRRTLADRPPRVRSASVFPK